MPNSETDQNFIISTSKDFEISNIRKRSLTVKYKGQPQIFKILAPCQIFNSIHIKSISCLDVSSGGLGVSAGDDGIFIWETENGLVRRKLENGHVGDVYSLKFFPSGVVILSCGADMRIKIWSAENGSCPVTLTG